MEPIKITEEEEAELKVQTVEMFKAGGIENVLACVATMQAVQVIILKKLQEILEDKYENPNA